MTPVEFRRQVFRDAAQWGHGLSSRLRQLDTGGVALFSRPAFSRWITQVDAARGAASLTVDHCGRVFWMHRSNCELYRYDPINTLVEPTIRLGACAGDGTDDFGRMLTAGGRLWIVDRGSSRLLALRPDSFQITIAIALNGVLDAAVGASRLFSLDRDGIHVYTLNGQPAGGPFRDRLQQPIAIGADPQGRWIYVVDAAARGFLRYSAATGAFDSIIGSFDDVTPGFAPTLSAVLADGNLIVADGSAVAHEFAVDGGYVGSTGDISPVSAILGISAGTGGELYVGSPEGIARFSRDTGAAGNKGQFYTRTLDNGADRDETWHRLDLLADLDGGGALDVYYASTDDAGLAGAVSAIFDRESPVADRARAIESVLGDRWRGPQQLRALATGASIAAQSASGTLVRQMSHSMLFRTKTQRFLWLKLELSGLSPRGRAAVHEMRVYYPRLSYLRYLPAVYQQDPVSQEFLERFLSMFETVFSGLEATIERIPEVFDPERTPDGFLDWLAGWLDLGIEEDWSAAVKRRLITNAARLYELKGTPAGLTQFIEVVTGAKAVIREAFDTDRPLILGTGTQLGVDSMIFRQPVTPLGPDQRMVLGSGSILGTSHVRRTTHVAVNPFRAAAHHFTVLLDLTRPQYERHARALGRIIRDNTPAHVGYDIRLVASAGLGPDTVVGVNLRVEDLQPMRLGYSALGRAICASPHWFGPELGVDTVLAGPDADDLRDGER